MPVLPGRPGAPARCRCARWSWRGSRPPAATGALLVAREAAVKELLGIPATMATACHIVAGYPARPFPKRLHRPDLSELAFADRYGHQLSPAGQ